MQLSCQKCKRKGDGLHATAHKCSTCEVQTYSAFKHCISCAVEKEKCQFCGAAIESGRDEAAVKEVQAARVIFLEELKAVAVEYDAAVADIRSEIDEWLKVNRESSAIYNAGIKPFQDAYQTAAQALQVLQRSGAAADSEAIVAAKQAVDDANTALRDAMPGLQEQMWEPINEARAKIGEEKLKRNEDASRIKLKKTKKAERRFELVAERIAGHIGVDLNYKMQLEQLDKQFA